MKRYKDMNDYPIDKYPLDGTMRMMEKSEFETRLSWREYITRTVYRHKPTGDLYYSDRGIWYRTYPIYCYNIKTKEKGEWF